LYNNKKNAARCTDEKYINFLIATPTSYSCLEAGRVQPEGRKAAAHDAITRFLHRKEPITGDLWKESKAYVLLNGGFLILDDSTLDKFYARKIPLVYKHWSGKHHRTVQGINNLTALWTDGDKHIPCDFRVYDKLNDGLSKNDHFVDLLKVAHQRGFEPDYVCFDSWYSSLANLKAIRSYGWQWLTRLKLNRLVNAGDGRGNVAIARVDIGKEGRVVHLKGYGFIKVFKTVSTHGNVTHYWATNDLEMGELTRLSVAEKTWAIENYHRGIKQFCGIEKCQVRSANAQRNHIAFAIRAFLRLEIYSYSSGHIAKLV